MYEILDHVKSEHVFGEVLRDLTFKKRYGCYTCFELEKGFTVVDPVSPLGQDLSCLVEWDVECGTLALFSNGHIHVAWWWDGDGTLGFICGERAVVNSDCKKDDRWRWREVN